MKIMLRLSLLVSVLLLAGCGKKDESTTAVLQLNWLHDPSFTGEYLAAEDASVGLRIMEGGPNISAVTEVMSGRATIAVVGADIFLQAIDKAQEGPEGADLVCFFVDFQRNPVGWVLHPDAAEKAGYPASSPLDDVQRNNWLFSQFEAGTIIPGDKRGTETTSIWIQWKKVHRLPDRITVAPVGFDAGIVLGAPMLAYPVYLNEEPFKLSDRLGKEVLVFDPAADGIDIYGNVLITTRHYAEEHRAELKKVHDALQSGWMKAKVDPQRAGNVVARLYSGVSKQVLEREIGKTVEFVFRGATEAGAMDLGDNGRWRHTLEAEQEAGLVTAALTFEKLKRHLVLFK
jgi:ABC-type nitrate/sulfonate/bicarbonate transport system substrate-binding protein